MSKVRVWSANEEPEIEVDGFGVEEARNLKSLMTRFMKEYGRKPEDQSDEEWLRCRFLEELPELSEEDAAVLSRDTIESVSQYSKNLSSLTRARERGQTAEDWFAEKSYEAATGMSVAAFGQRMTVLDNTLETVNAQMLRAVTTKGGEISQSINLDGFIAEQAHVNTFNAYAITKQAPYRARVCTPVPGHAYNKNSVDMVIEDMSGHAVHRYQCKFGADAEATIQLIRRGNYNNQILVVPTEQVAQVQEAFPGKTVIDFIGGTERIAARSKPLTKQAVKEFQTKVQETGVVTEMNYGSYDSRMLAKFVGKQAMLAGFEGMLLSVGFHMAAQVAADEPIEGEEVARVALETGADVGVKSAIAGATKVAAERGMIGLIPPGTPISWIASMVCVAVENVKILAQIAGGELTVREGLDKMGCNTVAMVYGLSWTASGFVFGATALSWIPVVGPIIGGVTGGILGYMAGSKFGEKIYEEIKAVARVAKTAVQGVWETIKGVGRKIKAGAARMVKN